jgi:hypothetical protein
MSEDRQLPVSLKVVAVLFILSGINAIIEIIVALANGTININFGVLGIFIGIGIFRLRRGWRTCGLVFLWIALIAIPILTVLMFSVSGQLDFNVFGQKAGYIRKELAFVIMAFIFLLCLWQYRVLVRPDVRQLFGLVVEEL